MADDKTDIRLAAAILTAGQLMRGAKSGRTPGAREEVECTFAAKLYFQQIEALLVEKKEQPKIGIKFSN